MVAETLISDVATVWTTVRYLWKTSNTFSRKPCARNIRVETMLISVMSSLYAMDFTVHCPDVSACAMIAVPCDDGRREFNTRTGMFLLIAGRMVSGCSTRAPKYASSDASMNDITLIRCASGTIDGSAVRIPSTSVQIWISSASRSDPMSAAEWSDPPRPIVVVMPLGVAPMNPCVTTTAPRRRAGMTCWSSVAGMMPRSGTACV